MLTSYKDRCGGCARYTFCVIDGEIRKIGKCYTRRKGERTNLASAKSCNEYIDERRSKMTKAELNELVESLIVIRDIYNLSRDARDRIADACNVIYHNIDILAEDGQEK